jgi:hypothetical protein
MESGDVLKGRTDDGWARIKWLGRRAGPGCWRRAWIGLVMTRELCDVPSQTVYLSGQKGRPRAVMMMLVKYGKW